MRRVPDRPVKSGMSDQLLEEVTGPERSTKMDRVDTHLGMAGEMQSPEKPGREKVGGFCGGKSEAHDRIKAKAQHSSAYITSLILIATL